MGLHRLRGVSMEHPHAGGGGSCFLSNSQLLWLRPDTGEGPWALSTGLSQTSSCPLVFCHDASLAHVPTVALEGEWTKGTPHLVSLFSFSSHPNYTAPPHAPWGTSAVLGSRVWQGFWQHHRPLHKPASSDPLGSSSLSHVPFFFQFCSGPPYPALPPDLDGKLYILSLTHLHGFEL